MEIKTLKASQKTKKTAIGEIPVDWEVVNIKDVCKIIRGTEPGSKSYNTEGIGIRFLRISDLSKQNSDKLFTNGKTTHLVVCNRENILVTFDGVPGLVKKEMEGAICSGIRIVEPIYTDLHRDYLFYILQHKIVQKVINDYTAGATIKHASKSIEFIKIPLPYLSEQSKIAEILGLVDAMIDQTRAVIDQIKTVKNGLMQELFTRGIPGRHKKFKKTELGMIPEEWEIVTISDACIINPSKKETSGLDRNTEVSFLPMECVAEAGRGITRLQLKKLHNVENGYTYFKEGDVLFAKITPCMENGKIALATGLKNKRGFGSTEFHVLRPNARLLTNKFLFYWISKKAFRDFAVNYFTGTAGQQRVQADFFHIAKIPTPSVEEQKEITMLIKTVDLTLEKNEETIDSLNNIKSALMQVLLTGEVRVKG